jgi:hypothetical protein
LKAFVALHEDMTADGEESDKDAYAGCSDVIRFKMVYKADYAP